MTIVAIDVIITPSISKHNQIQEGYHSRCGNELYKMEESNTNGGIRYHENSHRSTKIVFLDCDGVVSPFGTGKLFDPAKMALLKRIVDATQAKIVLSTSWRSTDFGRKEVHKHLVQNQLPTFIGITPDKRSVSRSCEILSWLAQYESSLDIVNFVALDDINLPAVAPDREFFARHAIVTNGATGLTEADAERAIVLLADSNNYRASQSESPREES